MDRKLGVTTINGSKHVDRNTALEDAEGANKILGTMSDLLNDDSIAHGLESTRLGI